jgi:hypothetical protein
MKYGKLNSMCNTDHKPSAREGSVYEKDPATAIVLGREMTDMNWPLLSYRSPPFTSSLKKNTRHHSIRSAALRATTCADMARVGTFI